MNNKASQTLKDNLVYLILLLLFLLADGYFVWSQFSGASTWADYHAKETSRIINLASPGDNVTLDIHKATVVAQKNGLKDFQKEIFQIDNPNNELCFKLSLGRKTCYHFFNDVDIINDHIELAYTINRESKNVLRFNVVEVQRA